MSKVGPNDNFPRFAAGDFQVAKTTDSYTVETSNFMLDGDDTYFVTYWKPSHVDKPKGLVFICHGFGEYFCPSYDGIAEALVNNGFLVFGHDHIGHGRSTGQRVQVKSMDEYVLPLLGHVKKVQNDYNKEVPLSIIGHSMGGLITVHAAMAEPDLFKCIVLMGPLITMDPTLVTPFKKVLAGVFSGLLPSLALGTLDASLITRDEVVAKRVAEDPLCWHGGFKAQHSNMLIKATDVLAKENCLKKITAPLLIMQGGQDKLVCPDGATFCHDNVGSVDKKLLCYEDAFHNLFVELEDVKTTVIKETCTWIEQHSS